MLSGFAGDRTIARTRRRFVLRWIDALSGAINAKELGVEYLTRYPGEGDRATLISTLSTLVSPFSLFSESGGSAESLRAGIHRDFVEGHVVDMGGWLLSRSELRVCALAAVDAPIAAGVTGVFGLHRDVNGEEFYWTAPRAIFTVPSPVGTLEFQLRSGTNVPQRVTVRLDGKLADELTISDRSWRPIRYVMRRSERPTVQLELDTNPPWKPANDFRTIGVGIDRLWTPA